MIKETREIKDVEKVILRGYGEMFIRQGEVESLEIETDKDYMDRVKTRVDDGVLKIDVIGDWMDRITTFFSRGYESQRIKYYLKVKNLTGLDISGAAKVEVEPLTTEQLTVRLGGAADIGIDSLEVGNLQVRLPGAGSIKVKGRAGQQEVRVSGAGSYSARKLECQNAIVKITGVGKAIVWAVDELDISLSGVGSVEYYGNPRVKQNVSGIGHVTSKG
ncbi:MAG: head GIN domain-containing protein [Chloroflexota bacterium]|nr:head GIN domain-containing protein [Chloroflexota bacterium]